MVKVEKYRNFLLFKVILIAAISIITLTLISLNYRVVGSVIAGLIFGGFVGGFIGSISDDLIEHSKEYRRLKELGFVQLHLLFIHPDSKDVVIIGKRRTSFNMKNVKDWSHKWIQKVKHGSVRTSDHHIEFVTNDYNHPLVKGPVLNASNVKRFEMILAQ